MKEKKTIPFLIRVALLRYCVGIRAGREMFDQESILVKLKSGKKLQIDLY